MVRGRRGRAIVACSRNDDCSSAKSKRKEPKNILKGKLSHKILSPENRNTTITDFFQINGNEAKAAGEDEVKDESKMLSFHKASSTNYIESTPDKTVSDDNLPKSKDALPLTPHRIELNLKVQNDFPTNNKMVEERIEDSKLQLQSYKSRKKLNLQEYNDQLADRIGNKKKDCNHKLTEYFPIRRSVRKTKQAVLEEKQKSLEQFLRNNTDEGLKIKNFEGKGRGIIAVKEFSRGEFVVEYSGDLIDIVEAKKREEKYAQDQNTGCYMYYFKNKGQQYCIDATAETGRLGRLVNHSRNGNLVTRIVMIDEKPRLVLIARDDIKIGEEVLYD